MNSQSTRKLGRDNYPAEHLADCGKNHEDTDDYLGVSSHTKGRSGNAVFETSPGLDPAGARGDDRDALAEFARSSPRGHGRPEHFSGGMAFAMDRAYAGAS